MTPAWRWGGLYDLRLKLACGAPIVRVPEPLYTRTALDGRPSGERVFDYVAPRQRDYQREMETVATAHLQRIGAYLEPYFAAVPAAHTSFPVPASVVIPVRNRVTTIVDAVRSALAQTYTFDSFGKQTASTGSLTNPFRYTAREFDTETGLYYYRARYYDPNIGKFVNEDPIGFEGGENLYRYVRNRSTGLSDPMGLSPADVQRIQALCKKCIQDLTDQGRRLPGEGQLSARKTDLGVALGIAKALLSYWGGDVHNWGKLQGCKSQAGLAKDCLANDPALKGWTFSEVPWWLGSHTVVVGGANVLLGTAPAAVFLAVIRMALNASYGQIIGQIGMLFAVILIIRVLPEGISSVLVRRGR